MAPATFPETVATRWSLRRGGWPGMEAEDFRAAAEDKGVEAEDEGAAAED